MLNFSIGLCILILAFGLAIPFLAVYLKLERRQTDDPYLGIKTILAMLFSLGLQIAVLGLAVFIGSQFTDGGFAGYRLGLGLVLGGLLTATLPYVGSFAMSSKSPENSLWGTAMAINGTLFGIWTVLFGTGTTLSAMTTGLSTLYLSFTLIYLLGSIFCLSVYLRLKTAPSIPPTN
jgi:MFS family permease